MKIIGEYVDMKFVENQSRPKQSGERDRASLQRTDFEYDTDGNLNNQ